MSVVHSNLQSLEVPPQNWKLRTNSGSIFGPVALSTLADWAAQGRIIPGNTVSCGGKEWIPAEDVSELKLEWIASLADGTTYGPFNVLAIPAMYAAGIVGSESAITNRLSGKTLIVADILKIDPESDAHTETSEQSENEKNWEELYRNEKNAHRIKEAELEETIISLRRNTEELESSLGHNVRELERVQQELNLLEIDAKAKHDRSKDTLRRLEKEALDYRQSIVQLDNDKLSLEGKIEALTEDNQALQTALSASQSLAEKLQLQNNETELINNLKKEIEEITQSSNSKTYEAESKIDALTAELESLKTLYAKENQNGDQRETALLQEAQAARDSLASAQNEIATLQRIRGELKEQLDEMNKKAAASLANHSAVLSTATEENEKLVEENENIKRRLAEFENSSSSTSAEADTLRTQLSQLTEHYEQAQTELAAQTEAVGKQFEELASEQRNSSELKLLLEEEKARLSATKIELEKYALDLAEMTRARNEAVTNTENIRKEALEENNKMRSQLDADANLLNLARQKINENETSRRMLEQNLNASFTAQWEEENKTRNESEKSLQTEIENLKHQIETNNKTLSELKEQKTNAEAYIENLKKALEENASHLNELTSVNSNLNIKAQKLTEEIESLQRAERENASALEISRKQQESLKEDISDIKKKLADTTAELSARTAELKQTLSDSEAQQKTHAEEMADTKSKLSEASDIIAQLNDTIAHIEEEKRALTLDKAAAVEETKDVMARLRILRKEFNTVQKQMELKKTQLSASQTDPSAAPKLLWIKTTQKRLLALLENKSARRLLIATGLILALIFLSALPSLLNKRKTDALPSAEKTTLRETAPMDATHEYESMTTPQTINESWIGILAGPPLKNLVVRKQQDTLLLVFDQPLFVSGTNFNAASIALLEDLAVSIKNTPDISRVIVTGHSDGSQDDGGDSASESYGLGMARAIATIERLRQPGETFSFLPVSAGKDANPHPGDSALQSLKNRTVTLRIFIDETPPPALDP